MFVKKLHVTVDKSCLVMKCITYLKCTV